MAKISDGFRQAEFDAWVESRPPAVRALCKRLPPDRLYRMKSTGQRVTLHSYSERGTVTVDVTGRFNLTTFDRRVFGIDPDDLVECDLPASDEPIGTILTEQEDVEALIEIERAAMGYPPQAIRKP